MGMTFRVQRRTETGIPTEFTGELKRRTARVKHGFGTVSADVNSGCILILFLTGDWKVPRTRRLESLRYV
jgi:hypothetical protein